jgi:N-acetylmuramic acid 6-phosphate etherase
MMDDSVYLGIDIGGSWLKGVVLRLKPEKDFSRISSLVLESAITRVRSRLDASASLNEFTSALDELLSKLLIKDELVSGVGVSTAGVVDYSGKRVTITADHLKILKNPEWVDYVEKKYKTSVVLTNDAEAAAIGAAATGYLKGSQTIGLMPIGTGIGFFLWRNGRKWTPNKMLPLLGSIMTPSGSYDQIAGTAGISKQIGHDISLLFSDASLKSIREQYEEALANVIYTACIIYHTDLVLIGGGLAQAVRKCNYPLDSVLQNKINLKLSNLDKRTVIKVMSEGNKLQLIGTCLLAVGEKAAQIGSSAVFYDQISTEIAYDHTLELHKMDATKLVTLLWRAEEEAGRDLEGSLSDISEVSQIIAKSLAQGGRMIYIGAGTSGRLAATDTVELACTFGFPRERVYTLIAGGLSDAAIEIETNFEEDASAVPEMLLTGINSNDVVIGISVSGSAYYVQSALALAKFYGAYSILIGEFSFSNAPFCDKIIHLKSGYEIIAGSTRMKAGTATKKVLNFISTTTMILLGRVYGCYMIEVECINQKLIDRALNILTQLFKIEKHIAFEILQRNNLRLHDTIEEIDKQLRGKL